MYNKHKIQPVKIMLFFWKYPSELRVGLKINESKAQLLNRYFRVKSVREKKDYTSEVSELCNDAMTFSTKASKT